MNDPEKNRSSAKASKPQTDKVKAFFSNPDEYLLGNSTIPARINIVGRLLEDVTFRDIIEIGCGDGSIGLSLLNSDRKLTLVDVNESMIERARINALWSVGNVTYVLGDAFAFVPKSLFDVVLCLGVLAHVQSIDLAIERLSEIVKPGGKVIVQFTEHNSLWSHVSRMLFNKHQRQNYESNVISLSTLHPIFIRNYLSIERLIVHSDSACGLSIISLKLATWFKILTSFLGLRWIFSENIVLLRRTNI